MENEKTIPVFGEERLIRAYRSLDPVKREMVAGYAEGLLPDEEKPQKVVRELKSRIYAKYGNLTAFAKEMGFKSHTPMVKRLYGVTSWKVTELWQLKELLEIPDRDFMRYSDALHEVQQEWLKQNKK